MASPGLPPTTGLIELGRRARALHTIYNEALTHTIKTINYDRFIACFPTPARYCPESLKGVWRQMISRFEELARVGSIFLRSRLSHFYTSFPSFFEIENIGIGFLFSPQDQERSHGFLVFSYPVEDGDYLEDSPWSCLFRFVLLRYRMYWRLEKREWLWLRVSNTQDEFEDILRERRVTHLLNELDRLVEEGWQRKKEAEEKVKEGGGGIPDIV